MKKDFNLESTVFFKKIKGKLYQLARLTLQGIDASIEGKIKLELRAGSWTGNYELRNEKQDTGYDIYLPSIEGDLKLKAVLLSGNLRLEKDIVLEPHRKWEIHIQPFTHTDIGYTDLPSRVVKSYKEAIISIVDFCEETACFDADSKYRWNIETGYWLENAIEGLSKNHLDKVKKLVREGLMEITPLYVAHTSEFNDEEILIRNLYFAFDFAKQCGARIESAMSSDITGQPWFLPQILYRSGIKYFSTGVNIAMAKALKLPRPFYWQSLDGSKVMLLDTDERQAYQEGIMVGLSDSYGAAHKKLPQYLMNLEVEGNFDFDLLALRTPGYPGDNTRPNVKVSYIAREWNSLWEYPKLKVSTYTRYFREFEKKYGKDLKTYRGAWPDWWVNYHGAVAFETGVNRHTHTDILNLERWSTILNIHEPKKFAYPGNELKEIYTKMMLADEADWSSYSSVAEPDCLQTKGQYAEEAATVYQAAINTQFELEKTKINLSRIISPGTCPGIIVANSLSWERSQITEVTIPKKILSGKKIRILESGSQKEATFQLIEPSLHDRQTGMLRLAFNAENVPALGLKSYDIVLEDSSNEPAGNSDASSFAGTVKGVIDNDYYRLFYDKKTGIIDSITDIASDYELIDQKSSFRFNDLVYETTEKPRVVDLSQHEDLRENMIFLQPYFLKIHPYYHFPKSKDKLVYKYPVNRKLAQIIEGPVYTVLIYTAETYLCPEIRTKVVLDNIYKRICVENFIFKYETLDPEALYFAFPFNAVKPDFRLGCHGGHYKPESEQLPGSAKDWYCTQKWIDITSSDINIAWSAMEAPLVQLGGINTGKWLDRLKLDNGTIMSYIMNNYWWTNSPASQCGRFWFNYFISSHKPPFDATRSQHFGWSSHVPLMSVYTESGVKPKNIKEHRFIENLPGNVIIVGLKKSEYSNSMIIRLLEIAGKECSFIFNLSKKKIKNAFKTTPVEEDIKGLKVSSKGISIKLCPFEILTLRLEF